MSLENNLVSSADTPLSSSVCSPEQVDLFELVEWDRRCHICLDSYVGREGHESPPAEEPVRIKPCGHIFGRRCITRLVDDRDAPTPKKCPICRAVLCGQSDVASTHDTSIGRELVRSSFSPGPWPDWTPNFTVPNMVITRSPSSPAALSYAPHDPPMPLHGTARAPSTLHRHGTVGQAGSLQLELDQLSLSRENARPYTPMELLNMDGSRHVPEPSWSSMRTERTIYFGTTLHTIPSRVQNPGHSQSQAPTRIFSSIASTMESHRSTQSGVTSSGISSPVFRDITNEQHVSAPSAPTPSVHHPPPHVLPIPADLALMLGGRVQIVHEQQQQQQPAARGTRQDVSLRSNTDNADGDLRTNVALPNLVHSFENRNQVNHIPHSTPVVSFSPIPRMVGRDSRRRMEEGR